MNPRWTHHRRTRFWVTVLLLPALVWRVLVPPGFMPGTGANHLPTLQMCHGAGPLPAAAGSNHERAPEAPSHGAGHETTCVFAAAGTVAPPPAALAVLDGAAAPEAMPPVGEPGVLPRAHDRAHPARAPPAGTRHA